MTLPKLHHALSDLTIPSNEQDIKARQILAKDEKLLLMAKTNEGPDAGADILKAVIQVINNCIVTPGIDPLKLALFDIEYLFIKLRALSVTNVIKVAYQDNDEVNEFYAYVNAQREKAGLGPDDRWDISKLSPTEQQALQAPPAHEFEIDLNKVEIKWPENRNMSLKVNDIDIELKYPPAELYTDKTFLKLKGVEVLDHILLHSIKEIRQGEATFDTSEESTEELKVFLDDLPMGVYDKLRAFLVELPHLNYELKYTNKFGTEKKITLSTLSDFFTF